MVKRPVLILLKKLTAESVAIIVMVRSFDKTWAGPPTTVGNIGVTSISAVASTGAG